MRDHRFPIKLEENVYGSGVLEHDLQSRHYQPVDLSGADELGVLLAKEDSWRGS